MPSLGALGHAMEKYPNANVYEGDMVVYLKIMA